MTNSLSPLKIGVLALQGDFERHLYHLERVGANGREVRRSDDLETLDGLIIPGGESTTMSELIDRFDMRRKLREFCSRKAVWGTCAGMIMLAREVDDARVRPLNIIDMTVRRNGYGRQVHSFHGTVKAALNGSHISLPASFIRAPVVTAYGRDVRVFARWNGSPVLLGKDRCLASSFHTELDENPALLKYFLGYFAADSNSNP